MSNILNYQKKVFTLQAKDESNDSEDEAKDFNFDDTRNDDISCVAGWLSEREILWDEKINSKLFQIDVTARQTTTAAKATEAEAVKIGKEEIFLLRPSVVHGKCLTSSNLI